MNGRRDTLRDPSTILRPGKRVHRGTTLIEVMVAIAIMAMLGTGLLLSSSRGRSRATSHALAERMVEVFKQARETAVAQQRPVAVLLPSTATSPMADSYYMAEGLDRAVVRRSFNLASEMPGTYLFVGHWGLAVGSNSAPTPLLGANGADFNLLAWGRPDLSHAAYVYTPAGTLQSNRVEFAGAYHLVVCQSAEWTPQRVAGYDSALLRAVKDPVTIRLSKSGAVSLVPMVEGQTGVDIGGAAAFTGIPNPPVDPPLGANNDPPEIKVTVDPKPQPGTVPADILATVALDGYLTLRVEAKDPDGDPLDVKWTAAPIKPASGAVGSMSSPIRTQTSFQKGIQRSTWEWRPPLTARSGDLFDLRVEVRDPAGHLVTTDALALHKVMAYDTGTILFVDGRHGNDELYTMNGDGTNEVRLTHTLADEARPQLSPDGSRIMYVKEQDVDVGVLMTVGIDGQNPKRLLQASDFPAHGATPVTSIVGSCWSPDGTHIAVITRYGSITGGLDVYVCNADGTNRFKAHSDAPLEGLSVTDAHKITWDFDFPYTRDDPTKQQLVFASPYDKRYFVFFPDLRNSTHGPEKSFVGRRVKDLSVSYKGQLAWVEEEGTSVTLRVGDFDPDTELSAVTVLSSVPQPASPAWSPTADKLVFTGGASPHLYQVDAVGGNPVVLTGSATASEASWGP